MGVFEYNPMARQAIAVTRAVHTSTPVTFIPGTADIDAVIYARMYAIVANVVAPPIISVEILEPRSEILKNLSIFSFIMDTLSIVYIIMFANDYFTLMNKAF